MDAIPGNVSLIKDKQNLIGISIGGGAPLCPCLYIVQVGTGPNFMALLTVSVKSVHKEAGNSVLTASLFQALTRGMLSPTPTSETGLPLHSQLG